jgi:arginine/lysine/ornithine decarboxylase
MNTPICDFVKAYAKSNAIKLHMPGHKGMELLGFESLDITEIDGADSLYEASGIIAESEKNASELFGCDTYYSTEGSSHCIRAMMYLVSLFAKSRGEKPYVLAGRNAHKTFHSAVALMDMDVDWIYPDDSESYLSCNISAEKLEKIFQSCVRKPTVVYLTSPDYLGNILDIASISKLCHENGVLLAVDNAHGAYLKFLNPSMHPIDLGADICCDSAHKTLPVLTGGAYLHLSSGFAREVGDNVKNALALFGSTSPSYLILQSLDAVNEYLENHSQRLQLFVSGVDLLKGRLIEGGYELYGNEVLKITLQTKKYGYFGYDFAKILNEKGIVCEFCDPDFVVLMLTPEIKDLDKVKEILLSIEKREPINLSAPKFKCLKIAASVREAVLSPSEALDVDKCLGRVVAMASVGCPPAVPVAVPGEIVDENALDCLKYYNINKINVLK